jgi:tetratricopeptide (TPR) repeat protein
VKTGVKALNLSMEVTGGFSGGYGREPTSPDMQVLVRENKPIEFENVEPLSSRDEYLFILGQEYLNAGDAARALERFRSLPQRLWNSDSIPVIGRALYLTKDYAGVLELLEKDGIEKTYPVLLLLGNSCLELKKLDQAAVYFEEVRKYLQANYGKEALLTGGLKVYTTLDPTLQRYAERALRSELRRTERNLLGWRDDKPNLSRPARRS